jgi:hypothetical protein
MKINLRKASVVQNHIMSEIMRLSRAQQTNVTVNHFETNVSEQLNAKLAELEDAKNKAKRYLETHRFLRVEVAKCNVATEVNQLLAEDAMLKSSEETIGQLFELRHNHQPRPSDEAISNQLEKRRQSEDQYSDTVDFNVVPRERMSEIKAELEEIARQRRRIKDKLVVINVNTTFEISEEVIEVLRELGLD